MTSRSGNSLRGVTPRKDLPTRGSRQGRSPVAGRRRVLAWMVLALVIAALVGHRLFVWMTAPKVDGTSFGGPPPFQHVEIPEHASFKQVVALLDQRGLIRSRIGLLLLGKLLSAERRIVPGEDALDAGMRPGDSLAILQSGRIVLHPVTVPEGYSVTQVAELLAQKGLADASEFVALGRDPDFVSSLHIQATSVEGYLFPNTYQLPRGMLAKELIRTMVAELWRALTPDLRTRADELHMTLHEVLTLASLVEKETGSEQERQLVASVFHNRLRKRIPLQSDPTVIYGLTAFDGNLRKQDLLIVSPYNTYRIPGLPPGPIANPGLASIKAVLYPAVTDYLFFVSRNDGTHHFSVTLAEHNRAVDRYQRRGLPGLGRQMPPRPLHPDGRHILSEKG